MDATGFPSLAVFPLKQCHNDVIGAHNLPQTMRCCLLDPMMPSLTL